MRRASAPALIAEALAVFWHSFSHQEWYARA
jgi:hypothetical protein